MERKVFSPEELKYLSFALEKVGCYGVDEAKEEYRCPFWDWELRDEEGREGDCAAKHANKICVLLKVAEQGELALALRDRDSRDENKEREEKRQALQRKKDLLEQELMERQQALEECDRLQRKLKSD